MRSGKSFITAFTSSSPRQPMERVGQDRSACSARRLSALDTGWALTKDVAAASPKTEGAICRQASQSMQVESTKKSPGTFSGTRFLGFAMIGPPSTPFYPRGEPPGPSPTSLGDLRSTPRPNPAASDRATRNVCEPDRSATSPGEVERPDLGQDRR